MEDRIFKIEFDCEGKHYSGTVNPSEKTNSEGMPVSFHVILNQVNFGYVSQNNNKWLVDEQRPQTLVNATGNAIEDYYGKR